LGTIGNARLWAALLGETPLADRSLTGEECPHPGPEAHPENAAGQERTNWKPIPLAQHWFLMLKEWKLRRKRKKPEERVFPNQARLAHRPRQFHQTKFRPLFEKLSERHKGDPQRWPAVPALS
jgi:hypothetical protein